MSRDLMDRTVASFGRPKATLCPYGDNSGFPLMRIGEDKGFGGIGKRSGGEGYA